MKKNIFIIACLSLAAALILSCGKPANQAEAESVSEPPLNALTEEEKADGWELLFDGQTLSGWKRYGADTIGPLWIVRDGMIVCNGEGLGEARKTLAGL